MSVIAMPLYPAVCHACKERDAWPYSAGTCERHEIIIVKLRCKSCGHEWTAEELRPDGVGLYEARQHA